MSLRATSLAVLGLTALTLGIFREAVLEGRVLYERDIHLVWEAESAAFVRAWRSGSWPLWDDTQAFGQSLLANPHAQVLYPPTWLALVLPFWAYCTAYVTGHVLASGAGFFLLGGRLGLSPPAAFTGSALWLASGPFLSSASLWHHFAGAAWMPWVLLGLLVMKRRADLAGVALGSLPLAGQILAGSADLCALTLILGAGLVLIDGEAGPARLLRTLILLAGTTVLALGLTAAQWLTSLDAVLRSARADLGAGVRTYWSVHPVGLLDLFLPIQLAWWPLRPEVRAALYESREPFVPSLYLGLAALPFVLAGLAHPRRRLVWLLVGTSVAAMLVALGRHAPFYGAVTTLLPPLRILRYPVKALFLVAISWAILAGLGADVWAGDGRGREGRRAALFAGLGAALALVAAFLPAIGAAWAPRWLEPVPPPGLTRALGRHLGLAAAALALAGFAAWRGERRLRQAAAVLVGTVAVLDLAVLIAPVNPTAPREFYAYRPAVFRSLQSGPVDRCYVYNYVAVGGKSRQHLGRDSPYALGPELALSAGSLPGALALRSYMFPAAAASWGLRYGFDLDMTGLAAREVVQLDQLLWATEGTPVQLRLLQLGAVSHVVTLHDARPDGLEPAGEFAELLPEPVRLWRVPNPVPRILVVGGQRPAGPLEALRLLGEGTVDPRREVLLSEGAAHEPSPDFSGATRVLEERPGLLKLEATASHPGHLVILDAYAPGWRATLDGRPVPVLRGNGVFRAVALPAGRHEVECRYLPATLSRGGGFSLGLGLVMAVLLARRAGVPRGA